jgi:hypothetical protein
MWQDLIVYLIVAVAALYAAWRWMPIATRASVVSHAISFAKRIGLSNESAARWQAQASAKTGCGSCGPCKACDTKASDNRPESHVQLGS